MAQTGMLDFVQAQQQKHYTNIPRKVLAFYYTWYGRPENHGSWVHWEDVKPNEHSIASATHYPAKGAYDSHDPDIIDYHINLAKNHGIDGFICTWWGQGRFDDKAFVKVLERAEKQKFEVTIYWETAPGKGEDQVNKAVDDLIYVLEKYGSHSAFMKVDGKPVIFVYGRVMDQVPINEWAKIITQTKERYGKDFLLIADGYQDIYSRIFDGIHTYNICGWVQGRSADELKSLSKVSFIDAVKIARKHAKISCITIIPGYDDTKIRKPGINADRMAGKTFQILWEQAISADPDWVLITSWNEWHEGSEIEPSWEDRDKYIKITEKYAKIFKKTLHSEIPKMTQSISPEKVKVMQEIYKDKTIAILPNYSSDAVFWLVDTGVAIKELTWQEILNPEIFNVNNYPITVYAGAESYTQTLNEKEDIDRAIIRYMEEGGMLIAIPSEPFPFFYNEDRKPVSSASKFGFPIEGGWENPPNDLKLTFIINNSLLKGLPKSIPFPETGDLRWRPAKCNNLPAGDFYLCLAKLKDKMNREYGDGIAYIEHKFSSPKNGKNIYVWMRMIDILDRDNILYSVFSFAGEKMKKRP